MLRTLRHAACGAARSACCSLVPSAIGSGSSAAAEPGTLTAASFHSSTLGETVNYNVYLPAGYAASSKRYPVLYLLHGRGDSMSAWTQVKGMLDDMIARRRHPGDDRRHARRAVEQPGELLRRLRVHGAPIPDVRWRPRSRRT